MRKTIFAKVFLNNIIIITVSLRVLTISGGWVLTESLDAERDSTVEENAHAIQKFLESGIPPRQVEDFLYGISQSSNKNILLVNTKGEIMLASVNEQLYNKGVQIVPKSECSDVFEGITVKSEGTLGGVYKKPMITYQYPYISRQLNRITGAIIISMPAHLVEESQARLFGMILLTIGLVVCLALVLSYILSRKISMPIHKIGLSVRNFAKGDLSSRVEISDKDSNITEIQELANTFNDMAFHTEKAEEIRNSFISDVSHELRTPMTTIGGFVDGIMDGTIPAERQNDYLAIVKEEVTRLAALVNSFLDVTRNDNAKKSLEISSFDINEVIRRTVINLESEIIKKEILVDIVFEIDPCYVKADKNLIRSVMSNLLENAVKFTNQKGNIRITQKIYQHEVFVSVYNTGCGIAEEDKPFVFERFYKADKSRSVNRQGTGIGLYLVKDVLSRHGKTITLLSEEGKYAEFTFSLEQGKEL